MVAEVERADPPHAPEREAERTPLWVSLVGYALLGGLVLIVAYGVLIAIGSGN